MYFALLWDTSVQTFESGLLRHIPKFTSSVGTVKGHCLLISKARTVRTTNLYGMNGDGTSSLEFKPKDFDIYAN